MPKRLFLALILLVAAPLVLLGLLTSSTYQDQERSAREQINGLYQSRLIAFENETVRLISGYETELMGLVSASTEQLRRFDSQTPFIRTSLLVNRRGTLLYPPPPLTGMTEEAALYRSLESLASSRPATGSDSSMGKGQKDASKSVGNIALPDTAWQVWYMDEGIQLVHWRNVPGTTHSLGTLLERSRWIADLTAALPNSPSASARKTTSAYPSLETLSKSAASIPITTTGYTQLVDQRGNIMYRWGAQANETQKLLASRSLPAPLADWTFEAIDNDPISSVSPISTLLSLAGLAILLVSLGGYVLSSVRRQMNEAQSRVSFASQVSHELRTPLTNIRLYAELAQSDLQALSQSTATTNLHKRLHVIDTESQRLGRLVSGVLEVIRDRKKIPPPRLVLTSPDEVIDLVIEQFRPSFQTLEMEVQRTANASAPALLDPDLLEMVLVNLFSNVEKYAASGKWIGIDSERVPASNHGEDQLIVRVTDAGPGISWRHRKTVFAPFERLDDSISAPSGTGIGLTIAQQMAHRHGGTLTLVDASHGDSRASRADPSQQAGACFELRLPLKTTTEKDQ